MRKAVVMMALFALSGCGSGNGEISLQPSPGHRGEDVPELLLEAPVMHADGSFGYRPVRRRNSSGVLTKAALDMNGQLLTLTEARSRFRERHREQWGAMDHALARRMSADSLPEEIEATLWFRPDLSMNERTEFVRRLDPDARLIGASTMARVKLPTSTLRAVAADSRLRRISLNAKEKSSLALLREEPKQLDLDTYDVPSSVDLSHAHFVWPSDHAEGVRIGMIEMEMGCRLADQHDWLASDARPITYVDSSPRTCQVDGECKCNTGGIFPRMIPPFYEDRCIGGVCVSPHATVVASRIGMRYKPWFDSYELKDPLPFVNEEYWLASLAELVADNSSGEPIEDRLMGLADEFGVRLVNISMEKGYDGFDTTDAEVDTIVREQGVTVVQSTGQSDGGESGTELSDSSVGCWGMNTVCVGGVTQRRRDEPRVWEWYSNQHFKNPAYTDATGQKIPLEIERPHVVSGADQVETPDLGVVDDTSDPNFGDLMDPLAWRGRGWLTDGEGTSFAAPVVTGLLGVCMGRHGIYARPRMYRAALLTLTRFPSNQHGMECLLYGTCDPWILNFEDDPCGNGTVYPYPTSRYETLDCDYRAGAGPVMAEFLDTNFCWQGPACTAQEEGCECRGPECSTEVEITPDSGDPIVDTYPGLLAEVPTTCNSTSETGERRLECLVEESNLAVVVDWWGKTEPGERIRSTLAFDSCPSASGEYPWDLGAVDDIDYALVGLPEGADDVPEAWEVIALSDSRHDNHEGFDVVVDKTYELTRTVAIHSGKWQLCDQMEGLSSYTLRGDPGLF